MSSRVGKNLRAPAPQPLRVVHVIASLDPMTGGPPEIAIHTSLALCRPGIAKNDFVFLYERALEEGEERNAMKLEAHGIVTHGFPLSRLPARLGWRWGISGREVAWLLRRARDFDVLHLHGGWTFTTLSGLLIARLTGRVAVLSPQEALTDFDRRKSAPLARLVKRLLRAYYLRAFDVVIASSTLEQRDSGDPDGQRMVVIPHAVGAPPPRDRRPHSRFRIGYLGRLHPKKNVPLLLEALRSLDTEVELVVAGDSRDDYCDELRRLAVSLGVADRVTWLGFVAGGARDAFLASVDVVVMASEYECFGMAGVEALAAGVPVIVTPNVGIAETVAAYGAGLVVYPGSEAVADALSRFASQPELREACARAAVTAAGEYSPETHGERMITAFRQAAAVRRRRRAFAEGPA